MTSKADQAVQQGTEADAFEAAFQAACVECITEARKRKPRLAAHDETAWAEIGRLIGAAMAKAGATRDEARHYGARIIEMVLAEAQA